MLSQPSFEVIAEEEENDSKKLEDSEKSEKTEAVEFTRPFVRPVMRRKERKSVRPLSESIDYSQELMEKLEAPTLRRFNDLAPEERFKRSSLR